VATIDMGLKEGGGAVPLSRSGENPQHRNISTNYYLVVEIHTVTVRSDDAQYLLN